jgi:hypothetical protein
MLSDAPKLNVDWFLGDDVGYQLGGLDSNGNDTFPSFPGGLSGVARAVGYQIEISDTPIITPVIAGPSL